LIKCVSFDFDRTIAHVTPLTHHFVPELLAQKGINVSVEQFLQHSIYLRRNLPEYLADRFSKYGTLPREEREQFLKEYNSARVDMIDLTYSGDDLEELKNWLVEQIYLTQKKVLYDDVVDTIVKLKQLDKKIYILSGNHSDGITELLDQAGILDSFEEIITVDKYFPEKTDNYQVLLEKSQFEPEEILHIGDDVTSDGFGPKKHNINVLIIRREKQMVVFEDPNNEFKTIITLQELFGFL
jgi:HAD superfamily hydrolase (TIGR01549 family)